MTEAERAIEMHEFMQASEYIEDDRCPPYTEECEKDGHEENQWCYANKWKSYEPKQCLTCYCDITGEEHG